MIPQGHYIIILDLKDRFFSIPLHPNDVMISATMKLTLLGSRAMHVWTSSQAEVPKGPRAQCDPHAAWIKSSTYNSAIWGYIIQAKSLHMHERHHLHMM